MLWVKTHHGAVTMAALLALSGPLTFFTGALSVMREPTAANIAQLAFWWLAYGFVLGGLLLVSGYALMLRMDAFSRPASTALWLPAACLVALVTNLLTAGRAEVILDQGLAYSSTVLFAHGFVVSFTMTLLYFAHLRRSQEHETAASRLATAQAAQRNARQRIAQVRVQELQARVDPQMLFKMLDAVRRLYASDPVRAERFLDELIAFLRTALRRLRSVSSSLSHEVDLAGAFVSLQSLAAARELHLAIDIAADAGSSRFPPGVLLPLLDSAIACGGCRLHLTACCFDGMTCLALTPAGKMSDEAHRRVLAMLGETFEAGATLESEVTDGVVRTVVRVPHEPA